MFDFEFEFRVLTAWSTLSVNTRKQWGKTVISSTLVFYLALWQKTWRRLGVHGNKAGHGPWSSTARSCPIRPKSRHRKPEQHCRVDLALLPLSCWLKRDRNKSWWWENMQMVSFTFELSKQWFFFQKLNNVTVETKNSWKWRSRCTFWQRDGDDDSVSCSHPQAAAGHHQSCDSHKGETQFTRTCNTQEQSRVRSSESIN